jgi:hypothetical protein
LPVAEKVILRMWKIKCSDIDNAPPLLFGRRGIGDEAGWGESPVYQIISKFATY